MPEGNKRSRTFRRAKVRVPSGKSRMFYLKRRPDHGHCAQCGVVLNAVPRLRPFKMMTMPKTKKRPERPYGGQLCSSCMRRKIINESRKV